MDYKYGVDHENNNNKKKKHLIEFDLMTNCITQCNYYADTLLQVGDVNESLTQLGVKMKMTLLMYHFHTYLNDH